MTQQVLSANRLRDGIVVYLTRHNTWSELIATGEIVGSETGAADLLVRAQHAAAERVVVDPYLIEIAGIDGEIRPIKYREFIRATGPTIRPDLSKQNYLRDAKEAV